MGKHIVMDETNSTQVTMEFRVTLAVPTGENPLWDGATAQQRIDAATIWITEHVAHVFEFHDARHESMMTLADGSNMPFKFLHGPAGVIEMDLEDAE